MKPLKLTPEQIEAARSPRGGWTAATLRQWGVPWPPPKGWKKRFLAGKPVLDGWQLRRQRKRIEIETGMQWGDL